MGSGVPLLNEYKQEFLWKRLPQTMLGGPKLRLGYDAPAYIYINQVVLFLVPWVFSSILTPLVAYNLLRFDIGIYVISAMTFIYVLLVNGFSAYMKRTKAAVSAVARNAQNVLAEEDEIEFTSCCGVDAITFVVPGKKFTVNIFLHATLSAAMVGLGFWYFLPDTLNNLYGNNLGSTLTVHILGWFTICVAQYSLTVTAPPETATYSAEDSYELAPLMRPFYCFLFFAIDLFARFYSSNLVLANQVGHAVIVTLPLLWTVGLLSPLTAFITWLIEQTIIFVFGGSAMASDMRSLVMVVLSTGSFLMVYFIPYGLVTTILMATIGYILATDVGALGAQLVSHACQALKKPQPNEVIVTGKFLWRWSLQELLFHLCILVLTGALVAVTNLLVAPSNPTFTDYLLYGVMGLLVVDYVLTDVQSVYVFFGLWRNRIFPSSTQRTTIFHKGKTRLKPLGYIRRFSKNFIVPGLVLCWLAMSFTFTDTSSSSLSANSTNANTSTDSAAHLLGIHRTYRWLWQNTVACMVDLTIYQLLRLAIPTSATTWHTLPAGLQLLLVSLIRDRAEQLAHKLYFYGMLLITSWSDKKQRRRSTVPIIIVNLLLLPLVLGIVVAAAALSAPLLPLFTLPVFFIGYTRPQRGWPGSVGASANNCADTVYYRHLAPELAKALSIAAANGSIGEPIVGGHYLVRFQDRLTWVQVLERGYLYMSISIKGLELQETSCHTMEALRIDDLFEETFERENGTSCCTMNPHPLNVLRPYDTAYVKTYSDARNQLTGVIDSPESLRLIADGFVQALVWILLHHCHEKKKRGEIYLTRPNTAKSKTAIQHVGRTNTSSHWEKLNDKSNESNKSQFGGKSASSMKTRAMQPRKASFGLGDDWQWDGDSNSLEWDQQRKNRQNHDTRPLSGRSRPTSGHSRKTSNSLKSLNDSWASDNESLILEEFDTKKKPNLVALTALREQLGPSAIVRDESDNSLVLPPLREDQQRQRLVHLPGLLPDGFPDQDDDGRNSAEDFLNDMDFGLPAADINQPRRPAPESHVSFKSHVTGKSDPRTPGQIQLTSLSESLHFATLYSRLVSPPLHWRDVPVERRHLAPLLDKFPKAWYRYVIGVMRFDVESGETDVASEIAKDTALEEVYMRLVMSCYAIVNVLGSGITDVVSLGPAHVHKVYIGDIPWSTSVSWLQEEEELCNIVIQAFRYGVKLAVDQVLLGEVSSLEELQAYMEEYQRDYYIGLETDPGWTEAILKSTPNLFSLNYIPTQGTFSSRVLTLQDLAVHIGSVSQEAVRGQWANLALELLYMTNDDEERNSIQAHATLLRNLTVQAADPPLGYPVYASTPVSIPTL